MLWRTNALAAILALGVAAPALAQDGGARETPTPAPKPEDTPKPVETPKPEEGTAKPAVDKVVVVKGNRFELELKTGRTLRGLLPKGVKWVKRDDEADYSPCERSETGAGLLLQYVMNMDGEIFVPARDIVGEPKDLGAPTPEEVRALQDKVLEDRRRVLEEQARRFQEAVERMRAREKTAEGEPEKEMSEEEKKRLEEEKKGDALLQKFPPPGWSEEKLKEFEHRAVVFGLFPDADEKEFINGIQAWKAALERKNAREAKEKADKEAKEAGEKPAVKPAGGPAGGTEKTGEAEKPK